MENSIPVPPKKKNSWYGKIETKEEALKVIKDSSYGFFFVAVLEAVIGFALGMNLWLDAILYLTLWSYFAKIQKQSCSYPAFAFN